MRLRKRERKKAKKEPNMAHLLNGTVLFVRTNVSDTVNLYKNLIFGINRMKPVALFGMSLALLRQTFITFSNYATIMKC